MRTRARAEDAPWAQEFDDRFVEAVNNDLNTAQALAVALELVGEAYRRSDKRIWNTLKKFDSVLGLGLEAMRKDTRGGLPPEIAALQSERDAARASKDFKRADELRKELEAKGYEVKDQRGGSDYNAPQRRRLNIRAVALLESREHARSAASAQG